MRKKIAWTLFLVMPFVWTSIAAAVSRRAVRRPPPVAIAASLADGMTVGELRDALDNFKAEQYVTFAVSGEVVKGVLTVSEGCYEQIAPLYWIAPRHACDNEPLVVLE